MRLPSTVIVPSVGESRPPMRFNSVVLPDPDGPIRARKSPRSISRSTWCRTSSRSLPRSYTLLSCRISTNVLTGVSSWFAYLDAYPVAQVSRRRRHHAGAARDSLDQPQVPEILPGCYGVPVRPVPLDDENHRGAVTLHDRRARHQNTLGRGYLPLGFPASAARRILFQERDAHAHVRQDTR